MPTDIPIQCECGQLRGTARGIEPAIGNRVICYCDDCQAFAHFLEKPDQILDRQGGSDVFQLSPARIEWTSGMDQLACMRLSPKGLLRWYAACCNTPVGNTLPRAGLPFIGLVHSCLEHSGYDADTEIDVALGPIRARVNAKFAKVREGEQPPGDQGMGRSILQTLRIMLGARLRGDHRRSPFFDAATRQPVVTPRVLTDAERRAVMDAVHAD